MKIRPHIQVHSLTTLMLTAGMIIIALTHYNDIDIYKSLIPVVEAFGKRRLDFLLLLYSVFALSAFVVLKTRTGKISKRRSALDCDSLKELDKLIYTT